MANLLGLPENHLEAHLQSQQLLSHQPPNVGILVPSHTSTPLVNPNNDGWEQIIPEQPIYLR